LGKKSKVKRKNRKKNQFSNRIKKVNPNPNPKGKENEDGNGDDLPGLTSVTIGGVLDAVR
jgi:hypothetical protein